MKDALTPSKAPRPKIRPSDYLSTGSTLLNLGCSGRPDGGFFKGGYFHIVGDSQSGKTFLLMTCAAEAANNPEFDNYDLVFDGPENGALMDVRKFFGRKLDRRLRPPRGTPKDPEFSSTVEEFYDNVDRFARSGRPFVYLLDSMDALSSDDEMKHIDKASKAREKAREGKAGEAAGTMSMSRQKANSTRMRICNQKLFKTKSILVVVSQAKINVGPNAMFEPKTVAGGLAMKYYAQLQLWSSIRKKIKKDVVKGKSLTVGKEIAVNVRKNRVNGKDRKVVVTIYDDTGFDDTGSCIDYLVDWRHWPKAGGKIRAKELGVALPREALVRHIEDEGLEHVLRDTTAEVWRDVESRVEVKRKSRYA